MYNRHNLHVAMKLQEVMPIYEILYNDEAWHCVTKCYIMSLKAINELLLRRILQAHRKIPQIICS